MSSLENIADAKVRAAVARRLDALTPAIVSIRQEINNRGLLPSSSEYGRMIYEVYILLIDEVRDDMKMEYGIVLDSAIWPTESRNNQLISRARYHFDAVIDSAQNAIQSATQSLARKATQKEFQSGILKARDRALTDLCLYLDGHSKIQIYKKVTGIVLYLPKLILNLTKLRQ